MGRHCEQKYVPSVSNVAELLDDHSGDPVGSVQPEAEPRREQRSVADREVDGLAERRSALRRKRKEPERVRMREEPHQYAEAGFLRQLACVTDQRGALRHRDAHFRGLERMLVEPDDV
jgi:hypothetical protein